jgi:DNA uptake protein ComE-like DNA-binding protein
VSSGKDVAHRSRWPYISLIPIGLGAWAPVYAGVRARRPLWILLGIIWSAVVIAGFLVHDTHNTEGALLIIGWAGAIATSFSIRGAYERQRDSPLMSAAEAGQQRLRERAEAARIARENPALAQEMGIGRPDVTGAADGGVVDVNNASVTALLKLPGVDGDVATLIVEAREKVHGFASLEDMGAALDLDAHLVEGLRGAVVFLPRRG